MLQKRSVKLMFVYLRDKIAKLFNIKSMNFEHITII